MFGLQHSLPYELLLYSASGLALDVAAKLFRMNLANPLAGLAAGAAAHSAKYLFATGYPLSLGLPKNVLVVGIATGLGNHVLFGAIGGLLGGVVLWRLHRSRLAGPA